MGAAIHFTAAEICKSFAVSHMALYHWCQGTATRDPLPCSKDESGRRMFAPKPVLAWAKKYGLECKLPAQSAGWKKRGVAPKTATKKAGAKPRQVAKTAAKTAKKSARTVTKSAKATKAQRVRQTARVLKAVKKADKLPNAGARIAHVASTLAKT